MKTRFGFTLIEIMISTAIVAIISAISLPQIYRSVKNDAVNLETQRLVAFMRNAQAATLSGKNASGGGFAGYQVIVSKDPVNKYELFDKRGGGALDSVSIEKDYISIEDDSTLSFEPFKRSFNVVGSSTIHIKNDYGFQKCVALTSTAGLIEMIDCP